MDVAEVLGAVPELALAKGLGQGPYHHLDVLDHTLEVLRSIERERQEDLLGARILPERTGGLRLVGLLHDVAKPVTRGKYDGKVLFVAHDTLGATFAHRVCRRLGISARDTDLVTTLTALHLKIGFMSNERSDYPPSRLVRAAGPFGEELTVLSWADRVAAQGPKLKREHLDRHYDLCVEFLRLSRESDPPPTPDYHAFARNTETSAGADHDAGADAGYAASRARLAASRFTASRFTDSRFTSSRGRFGPSGGERVSEGRRKG